MRNDDIEILEDFSDNTMPNNNSVAPDLNQNPNQQLNQMPNQNLGFAEEFNSAPKPVPSLEPIAPSQSNESVSEFEKMVNEASTIEASTTPVQPLPDNLLYHGNTNGPANGNQPYDAGLVTNDYAGDANNDLVQPSEPKEDLTITAVYPNGLVVDQKEELENTQVIKPKKKSRGDLPLIIIVAVLAITLVVLLIVFYL